MTVETVYLQAAYILRQQHYRETSLLLDVFTYEYGKIALLAKGVRKTKSKTAGLLQPFMPLRLSYLGKSGLKIVTHVEIVPPVMPLQGLALYCGFYINELIGCFLHEHDPHPELFDSYRRCLLKLAQTKHLEAALRQFELELLEHTGYGLQLDGDADGLAIAADKRYRFAKGDGFVADIKGVISGTALLALSNQDFSEPQTLTEAKLLMRMVIDSHLQGKPLKSRAVINQIIKQL